MKKQILIGLMFLIIVSRFGVVVADPEFDFNLERNPMWAFMYNLEEKIDNLTNLISTLGSQIDNLTLLHNMTIIPPLWISSCNISINDVFNVNYSDPNQPLITFQQIYCYNNIKLNTIIDYLTLDNYTFTVVKSGWFKFDFGISFNNLFSQIENVSYPLFSDVEAIFYLEKDFEFRISSKIHTESIAISNWNDLIERAKFFTAWEVFSVTKENSELNMVIPNQLVIQYLGDE